MDELSVGTIVGLFIVGMIAVLIADHYRREHLRDRLLRRMNHHWRETTRHRS
ncbi:hypothetical protein BX589_13264 [Paraburkholderia fungorum]|uniref:hypothetical protein n=1 Tax=Paraburkholderia fungorum TaxID=134537 RepID=UPI000D48389E|nr:hypothetical protein [Paraburkholderia fungorum]PRZ46798.1 hypothetical protein BX589_13264 [Paraburkholderia fungorum]